MSVFGRLLNRAAAAHAPALPGAVDLRRRVERANRFRDQYNPLRSLTLAQTVALLEAGQRGEFADLQWTYRAIERRDEDLMALIERRTGALLQLDWNIKTIDERRARERGIVYDERLAEEQAATLRAAYERLENLYEGIEALAMASFREYAMVQFAAGDQAALPGTATRLVTIDSWNILRDGLYGDWYWNPDARSTSARSLGDGYKLDPRYFLIRTWPRPLDEIALIKFVRANLSQKDWDAFIELYGIPGWIVIMPPNTPPGKEDDYQAAAESVAQSNSGTLPHGADAKCADAPRSMSPFQPRLEYLTQKLVLAGTGGLLTMLTAPGSGTLAGSAHMEAFELVARSEARKIGEVLQRQFDKPILDASHPGLPRLAYFEMAANEEQDVGEIVDHAVKLSQAGYRMSAAELSEKTGYQLADAPPPAAPAPFDPLANRAGTAAAGKAAAVQQRLVDTATEAAAAAERADLRPLAERLYGILEIEDPELMVSALRRLRADLPGLAGELLDKPQLAAALEAALGAAAVNGMVETTVAHAEDKLPAKRSRIAQDASDAAPTLRGASNDRGTNATRATGNATI